jgi:hypothetical protein
MEYLVQGLLNDLGAPVALITPTVGAVIIAGLSFKSYEGAKESANREGTLIYKDLYFWASIALGIWSLSGFWMAWQVLIAIPK